jgi:alpha-glucosidase
LNFHCPAVRDAIDEVCRFWFDLGVDGFRLDAVQCIACDPALHFARNAARP